MSENINKELPLNNNCIITIIGIGYVGLPLAIEFAKTSICKRTGEKLDRKIFGFDINKNRIEQLKDGYDYTSEINDYEKKFLNDIHFTNNYKDILNSDVYIITVPTPIDSQKIPNLKPLDSACRTVAKSIMNSIKNKQTKQIIIFESTVYPGATEEFCIPIIEEITNLKRNIDFVFGYSPERINPGDIKHRLSTIKKITSGSDESSRNWIDKLYGSIISASTLSVSDIKIAEAAKVIENTQRDLNIALINELALIFQKMGIDTKEVIEAASTKWNFVKLFPGLVGGHCIGVDPYYLTYKSMKIGYFPNVILAGRRMNDSMGANIAKLLLKEMVKNSIVINAAEVLIMGFSFKENCPDFRNTGVLNLFNELKDFSCNLTVFDPLVDNNRVFEVHKIEVHKEIPKKKFNAILIAVGHSCFKKMGLKKIKEYCYSNSVIFDLKYIFETDDNIIRL